MVFLGTVPTLTPFNQLIQLPVVQLTSLGHSRYWLIGKSAIQKIAKDIVVDLPLPSDEAPFALVSMPRGGKTRALLELTRDLRVREGIPTIYITFNDVTEFSTHEERLGDCADSTDDFRVALR